MSTILLLHFVAVGGQSNIQEDLIRKYDGYDGLQNEKICGFFTDQQDIPWVYYERSGLYFFDGRIFRKPAGFPPDLGIMDAVVGQSNIFWLLKEGEELVSYNPQIKSYKVYSFIQESWPELIDIESDQSGTLFALDRSGTIYVIKNRFSGGIPIIEKLKVKSLTNVRFTSLLKTPHVVYATSDLEELFRYSDMSNEFIKTGLKLFSKNGPVFQSFAETAESDIYWIEESGKIYSRISDGQQRLISPIGGHLKGIYSIVHHFEGILWISSDHGLMAFDPEEGFEQAIAWLPSDHFQNEQIQQLAEGANDRYWIITETRILNIPYPDKIGLPDLNDNSIWTFNISDRNGSTVKSERNNELSSGPVSISFNSQNHYSRSQPLYTYRIEGLENKWSPFDTITHLHLNLDNPGKYEFQVRQLIPDGRILSAPAQTLLVKSRFWSLLPRILNYVLAMFLATLAMIFLVSKFRQRRQKKELIKMRDLVDALKWKNRALQLQLNPHFLSNTLAGIHALISLNKTTEAATYLRTFSHLMREWLEIGNKDWIPLNEEIEFLARHVKLENFRLGKEIKLNINNTSDWELSVPTMIFQPILENAFNYSFKGISKGNIEIEFNIKGKNLSCKIIDDGRGIADNTKLFNKGHSLEIIRERLIQLTDLESPFIIIDREVGLEIHLLLPFTR